MDSDDNCLVIDEAIADMEVSSTSETLAPKDTCEIENHNENEADSSVANSFVPLAESTTIPITTITALDLSTKKSSTHRDGDRWKEKNKDKEKDRHRDKRRSKDKDDRRKMVTPTSSDKYRSFSKKSNCIDYNESMLKERILNVS